MHVNQNNCLDFHFHPSRAMLQSESNKPTLIRNSRSSHHFSKVIIMPLSLNTSTSLPNWSTYWLTGCLDGWMELLAKSHLYLAEIYMDKADGLEHF